VWFPRPDDPADLQLVAGSGGLSDRQLFELLTSAQAEEWTDKVGVAGPVDGSAKDTTRLLAVDGWVLKTNVHQAAPGAREVFAGLDGALALSRRVRLWHPSKQWFCLHAADRYYPVSACRRLQTLRELKERKERFLRWVQMFEVAIWADREHGIGLDINPSNFGLDSAYPDALNRPFYLDDELYEPHGPRGFGEAIASRIPEEINSSPTEWYGWGRALQTTLCALCETRDEWQNLFEGLEHYPLHPRYHDNREALASGIREGHPLLDPNARRRTSSPPLTCILADVHGNLAALDAVMREAQSIGARRFVFLGDAVGYGPHPRECVARLADIPGLVAVRGNHDHAVATGNLEDGMNRWARQSAAWTREQLTECELDWLMALPLEHCDESWMALHGAPMDPRRFLAYVYELTYQDNLETLGAMGRHLCFYGHTHVQFTHRQRAGKKGERLGARPVKVLEPDEVLLVNPGSVGQPRDGDTRAGFAIWDHSSNRVTFHRVEYRLDDTVQALRAADLPSDLIYRLEIGR